MKSDSLRCFRFRGWLRSFGWLFSRGWLDFALRSGWLAFASASFFLPRLGCTLLVRALPALAGALLPLLRRCRFGFSGVLSSELSLSEKRSAWKVLRLGRSKLCLPFGCDCFGCLLHSFSSVSSCS